MDEKLTSHHPFVKEARDRAYYSGRSHGYMRGFEEGTKTGIEQAKRAYEKVIALYEEKETFLNEEILRLKQGGNNG